MVFAAVLVVIAVVFAVLAVTGSAHRGAFTGLAILWTVMALAAVLLVIGIERRVRRPRQRQAVGEHPPAG
jgi:hypothetical protein